MIKQARCPTLEHVPCLACIEEIDWSVNSATKLWANISLPSELRSNQIRYLNFYLNKYFLMAPYLHHLEVLCKNGVFTHLEMYYSGHLSCKLECSLLFSGSGPWFTLRPTIRSLLSCQLPWVAANCEVRILKSAIWGNFQTWAYGFGN